MYAIGNDTRIEREVFLTVLETMQAVQRETRVRVRMDGVDADRVAGGLVGATFMHQLTMPVDGLPDPHRHAYVFVPDVTCDATEGTFRALQFGEIKRVRPPSSKRCSWATSPMDSTMPYQSSRGKTR